MGPGWNPVVMNDRMEMNFIKQGQRTFSDNRSYWIGGKTNTQPRDFFEYSSYTSAIFSTNEFNVSDNTGMLFCAFATIQILTCINNTNDLPGFLVIDQTLLFLTQFIW